MTARIGIVGVGAVGSRVARHLGGDLLLCDARAGVADGFARRLGAHAVGVEQLATHADLVVLASGCPQAELAERLLGEGIDVITTSDNVEDCSDLLTLAEHARSRAATLVVGAAMSPGLSGLLAATLAMKCDSFDEVHVAIHGTGGPDCARQHHKALAGMAAWWHDGEWMHRPAGSGRELCWFPEPIGGRDCYRAELADPLLLQRAMPEAQRISIRRSATRRDRLTARLPMLAPPHREGGIGALRVEVRGTRGGARVCEVAGVAERAAAVAAAVASSVAGHIADRRWTPSPGVVVLGDDQCPTSALLATVATKGIQLQQYVGADSFQ